MKTSRWIPLLTAVALAVSSGLCRAQSPIYISFDTGVPSQFYDASPHNTPGYVNYDWQSTNGPDGPTTGCEVYTMDGTNNIEIDPAFNVSFNGALYATITFQVMVDPSSGTTGTSGSGGYGNLQLSVRDASYSWNTEYYSTIYPPGANNWITYTANVPAIQAAHIQIQLQASSAFSGPVKVYIGNVAVLPPPDPDVLQATNSDFNWSNYGLNATWDSTIDAPYYNPVTGAGPTTLSPQGSIEFQGANGTGYPGGQLNTTFNAQDYEYVGVDVYYDGPTPSTTNDYGGFQMFIANGAAPYNWAWIGAASFNASMIGQWTHFTFPCASSGITNANGFAVQATPGSTAGNNPITWHMDNFQVWNPQVRPKILSFAPNTTPGGVKIAVDGDGTANQYDQEGICTPSATNENYDFFWINQTPATYSFTLTNFPSPSVAPGFEAHIYIVNGDTISSGTTGGFGYNETYSGVNYNAYDLAELQIENATNGGVNCNFLWKTNAPSFDSTNGVFCTLPNLTSANGTWALNFVNNTQGTITLNGTVETNFTIPDFYDDPNYNANFTPTTSFIDVGVFKNDFLATGVNDNQSAIFTGVLLTNTTVAISDNFSGPGLIANNAWQIAEYYEDASDRVTWIPANTLFWLTWNTTQSGYAVQSATSPLGPWSPASGIYTYIDVTGTNTVAAIPYSTLPMDFFLVGQ